MPGFSLRSHWTSWGWSLLTAALIASPARGDAPPDWHFRGSTIPDPPRQAQPWTPPRTTLPHALVTAATTLFRQGLADPRGCEYRAIEIATGESASGSRRVERRRGWVLPQRPGDEGRFAVRWDGVVYPVLSVAGPADVKRDAQGALAARGR